MPHRSRGLDLLDCKTDADDPAGELLIVEGESAWRTVSPLRDDQTQALLAMQGKPINAARRSRRAVMANPWINRLVHALLQTDDARDLIAQPMVINADRFRYQSVVMLFDPDADGIHCGGLLSTFFDRYFPALIKHQRLFVIRPPLFVIRSRRGDAAIRVHTEGQLKIAVEQLEEARVPHQISRYRGLASIEADVLHHACLDPSTRLQSVITSEDVQAFKRIFGKL